MGNSMMVGDQPEGRSDGAGGAPQATGDQGIRDQAKSQAQSLIDQAKSKTQDRVRSAAASGKTQAVETVSSLAQSLLIAGQQLQDQQSSAAGLVEQAATRLDRMAQFLETTDLDDIVQRTETWARRNPALFLGASFVVGILGARFLKSSPPPTTEQRGSTNTTGGSAQFADREVSRTPAVETV
jgi:ElaB/YqjD/DUF883 family membrane-anchored ribosome-binding protein